MRTSSWRLLAKLTVLFCMAALIMPAAALARPQGSAGASRAAATAASYYVSPTGSDANPGTLAAPFQTITKARDVVRTINATMAGDIYVYLRGGTYTIQSPIAFGPQDSGSNGYRIFYQAYPGETPVLSGATRVTGWTLASGNIYKASLNRSTKLRNLYVNDQRASMTSKTVTARGGYGTYSVTAGQASWAWVSGSKSDGVQYSTSDVPSIASNRDDLEIVNSTTWNENIVSVRDVITAGSYRVLLFQQPYGAIAQSPCCGAAFTASGTHTIFNAFEFLNSPGQFYFDKSTKTLYYYPRSGENMATADVQAPVAEQLITITGTSTTNRVKNLTFQGITFANTDYNLVNVAGSRGKSSTQGATTFMAFIGSQNWHETKYEIIDTLPGMITVNNSDSINFIGNTVKHSGNEGISLINDVVNSSITGNLITDIAGSGITVGHPQHVFVGDGGTRARFAPGVEGVAKNNTITNNVIYNISSARGFGGHAGVTAFFVDTLRIEHNHIQSTAYNGINLGWGWINFTSSTTARNNTVSYNRLINTLSRLHDSGAIYTLGQMPGTNINQNYVKGIPPATSGPTYGLHNDEGSAYITENDNVLDIDPGVKYTINSEDFGGKHDLTILRTYATVNKMGITPPNSRIDPPVAVPDNVWPVAQYNTALNSGVEPAYRNLIPRSLLALQDYVFPASVAVAAGSTVNIRSVGDPSNAVWFAPAGTTSFVEGRTMTRAAGTATTIAAPAAAGTYRLHLVNAQGVKQAESAALLRVTGSVACTTAPSAPTNQRATPVSSSQIDLTWSTVTPPSNCSVTYSVFRDGVQVAGPLSGASFSDTRLSPSTLYRYVVRAVDAAGSSPDSAGASATTQAGSSDEALGINAGGSAAGGFIGDAYFSGGSTYSTTNAIDTTQITGAVPPQAVFQTERYGEFSYTIPNRTPGSAQAVTLYFQESFWTAAGQRTFDVSINGSTVLTAFDIFAAAGDVNRAIARTFNTTANANGQVVIMFARGGGPDNPKVNGISVRTIPSGTPTSTPVTPTPVTSTPVTSTPVTSTPVTSTPVTPTPVTPTPVTPTPVTPTPGNGAACSPVTGTITAPFTYDGAGTFCWQTSNIPSYINSWNLTSLKINGVDFTNIYVAPSNMPPKINGSWYISYNGAYAWSHFEAK